MPMKRFFLFLFFLKHVHTYGTISAYHLGPACWGFLCNGLYLAPAVVLQLNWDLRSWGNLRNFCSVVEDIVLLEEKDLRFSGRMFHCNKMNKL